MKDLVLATAKELDGLDVTNVQLVDTSKALDDNNNAVMFYELYEVTTSSNEKHFYMTCSTDSSISCAPATIEFLDQYFPDREKV